MTDLFTRYVSMGPSRSLGELHKQTHLPIKFLADLSGKERWHERCEEIDKKARAAFVDDAAYTVAQVSRMHLAAAAALQEKAMKFMATAEIGCWRDAIAAQKLSVEIQRKTLGMDDQQVSAEEKIADLIVERFKAAQAKVLPAGEPPKELEFKFNPNLEVPLDPSSERAIEMEKEAAASLKKQIDEDDLEFAP